MTSQIGQQAITIHILSNISRSKGSIMKTVFRTLITYSRFTVNFNKHFTGIIHQMHPFTDALENS